MSEQEDNAKTTDLAPQQAMLDYLDDLLQDATAPPVQEIVTETRAEVRVRQAPVQAPPAPVTQHTEVVPDISEQVADRYAVCSTEALEPLPEWFAGEFQVLLFDANGLMLAVPLIELGGILRVPPKLNQLANQPAWHLGFLDVDGESVSVVDTLRWMAPERVGDDPLARPRYLVRIPGAPWALSCQRLFDAVTMRQEDVQWRTVRRSRRWLRGTVREHMCALLDAHALGEQLSRDVRTGR